MDKMSSINQRHFVLECFVRLFIIVLIYLCDYSLWLLPVTYKEKLWFAPQISFFPYFSFSLICMHYFLDRGKNSKHRHPNPHWIHVTLGKTDFDDDLPAYTTVHGSIYICIRPKWWMVLNISGKNVNYYYYLSSQKWKIVDKHSVSTVVINRFNLIILSNTNAPNSLCYPYCFSTERNGSGEWDNHKVSALYKQHKKKDYILLNWYLWAKKW